MTRERIIEYAKTGHETFGCVERAITREEIVGLIGEERSDLIRVVDPIPKEHRNHLIPEYGFEPIFDFGLEYYKNDCFRDRSREIITEAGQRMKIPVIMNYDSMFDPSKYTEGMRVLEVHRQACLDWPLCDTNILKRACAEFMVQFRCHEKELRERPTYLRPILLTSMENLDKYIESVKYTIAERKLPVRVITI